MQYTDKVLEEFDEKFPPRQNEPTHFDECKCWSCNPYRDEVKAFLSESIAQTEQEMMKNVVKPAFQRMLRQNGMFGVTPKEEWIEKIWVTDFEPKLTGKE